VRIALTLWLASQAAGGASIHGRVVDARGAPAPGVKVVLGEFGHATLFYNAPGQTFTATPGVPEAERGKYAAELSTDAAGSFDAKGLAPGEFSILATDPARGVGLVAARTSAGGAVEVEIRLAPPASVEARIEGIPFDPRLNQVELHPVSNGANVEYHPRLEPVPGSWSFRCSCLPPIEGWRAVGTELVLDQDYRATRFSIPLRAKPGESGKLSLDASSRAEVPGTVSDAAGKPLAGVSVIARSLEDGAEIGAVTDAAGRYRLLGLAPGKHALQALRWKVRELAGCGNGAQDVAQIREIEVPLADPRQADFRIEGFLPAPKVGEPAPAFDARTVDGRPVSLAGLRGKVVLLDFWATWCGSCRLELPHLIEDYARFGKDGRFEIVGVSVDEDLDLVPRFVSSRGLGWPQTALGPAARNPIARLFNVNSTPATVLVDASGRIAALNLVGEPLARRIEELLAGK
jgi:thiol-disulfide isomerase/thioredoxin